MNASALPLSHITVLDLTRVRSGPTAVRQFADWGADVIKIEEPSTGTDDGGPFHERHGSDFQNLQRNKRSVTLNLKSPEGLEIFKRMVAKADVLVENYRPDVKFRLGIDYESMSKINPRLVYGSISGFGQEGPYRNRPGFDPVVQGMGGLMSITGLPGQGPVRAGIAVSDTGAGLYLALGIMTALLERERSGKGQWVHTSLLQSMIAMLDFQASRWLMSGEVAGQAGNNHPTSVPVGAFKTADGMIVIAAVGNMFERLCKVMEMPELLTHPDYVTTALRRKNRQALNDEIEKRTVKLPSLDLIQKLNDAGVPAGPIYSIDKMFDDPQVKAIGMDAAVQHPQLGEIHLVGQGVTLERTPWAMRKATPALGENTDEILADLGYDAQQIAAFREGKVV
jgi:crotonobetainyl-CoA:carnitine CoA-transferase CaiB-like acyl-CoA transferase